MNVTPKTIRFGDYLFGNNQEIIDELTNNQDFYNCVMNIYNINEFRCIYSGNETII